MDNAIPATLDDDSELSEQVGRLRADLRAGLPDTRSPDFLAERRRQLRTIADSPRAAEDQAFVDSISVDFDELD